MQAGNDLQFFMPIAIGLLVMAVVIAVIIAVSSVIILRLQRKQRATLTQLKNTNSELQKAKDKAENANHAKSRYIIGMSHELRTPLNAILGYAQLLEQKTAIDQKPVHIIRRSGEHLSSLIDGLLDISRIETGRMQLQIGQIDFMPFLEQIIDIFTLQAEDKGLQFIYNKPDHLPSFVKGDEKRLRQVLINLLSNAVKYTDKGYIKFTLFWRNGIAHFHIEDSGQGIRQDDLERIFEPFERSEDNAAHIKGLGLGLTITRLLTNMMGGDIRVKSDFGKGSEFCVTLMLSSIQANQISKPETVRKIISYSGKRQSILLVDDDEAQRDLVRDLLTPLGFEVFLAENANLANEIFTTIAIDLFILDIEMPFLSGWELAKQIRQHGYKSPIIMLSANINELDRFDEEDRQHNASLAKPFMHQDLTDLIVKFLPIHWLYDEAEKPNLKDHAPKNAIIKNQDIDQLKQFAAIGYQAGIISHIDHMLATYNDEATQQWLHNLSKAALNYNFDTYHQLLEKIDHEE